MGDNLRPCLFLLLLAAMTGCQPSVTTALPPVSAEPAIGAKVEASGLHNVFRTTEKIYSGSSPDDEEGFRSLRKLGVKTIVSVDGARPDVETAHQYGMRYVHLPIGYDGVPESQALRLARAVRDLPGPVYMHCHHGQHRGPAAAAVVHLFLDEQCSVESALDELRRAGTDPRYAGLYAAPRTLMRPSRQDLDDVPADFPEVTPVAELPQQMVAIDDTWERLKLIRAAGWKTPPQHRDLEPAHEALQLVEQFREAARLPAAQARGAEFLQELTRAETAAHDLEEGLRQGKADVVEKAYAGVGETCKRCHARTRDVPKPR